MLFSKMELPSDSTDIKLWKPIGSFKPEGFYPNLKYTVGYYGRPYYAHPNEWSIPLGFIRSYNLPYLTDDLFTFKLVFGPFYGELFLVITTQYYEYWILIAPSESLATFGDWSIYKSNKLNVDTLKLALDSRNEQVFSEISKHLVCDNLRFLGQAEGSALCFCAHAAKLQLSDRAYMFNPFDLQLPDSFVEYEEREDHD